uniref:Uncharacterized protein n=1 Tax=Arundo donax TaxID=35708 RepID=A0A0A9FGB0_ARUDO
MQIPPEYIYCPWCFVTKKMVNQLDSCIIFSRDELSVVLASSSAAAAAVEAFSAACAAAA